ncbi:hypothetical protein EIN_405150 [Entamoeba invadens IP1]|uniref:Uncharacterized protein n=1 Tax=Entamoeba invadens IP1 TaxID=370355 RepID=A0A0A1UAA5_ENTIV|nr:hypothetical protein EIN_405150 [Entamoeba invadens IP1]ELP90101.1 hypothetical protein EIN_405150 [Entamoeba invadens IP1]|eukprot:XP_004256872.1 hypothetical protein EIN_405150 [Entamoeba invadens IP1]
MHVNGIEITYYTKLRTFNLRPKMSDEDVDRLSDKYKVAKETVKSIITRNGNDVDKAELEITKNINGGSNSGSLNNSTHYVQQPLPQIPTLTHPKIVPAPLVKPQQLQTVNPFQQHIPQQPTGFTANSNSYPKTSSTGNGITLPSNVQHVTTSKQVYGQHVPVTQSVLGVQPIVLSTPTSTIGAGQDSKVAAEIEKLKSENAALRTAIDNQDKQIEQLTNTVKRLNDNFNQLLKLQLN